MRKTVWLETLSAARIHHTVKSHFKALGLYNFIRGFGWTYKRGRLISGWAYKREKNVSERRDKTYLRNKLHFELPL